jgi:hypothetical protein
VISDIFFCSSLSLHFFSTQRHFNFDKNRKIPIKYRNAYMHSPHEVECVWKFTRKKHLIIIIESIWLIYNMLSYYSWKLLKIFFILCFLLLINDYNNITFKYKYALCKIINILLSLFFIYYYYYVACTVL